MADFTSLNGYDVKDKNAIHIQDVIDNLESTEMQKPLSANQGKELKNLIDNITIEESNLGNSIYDYNKDQYLNFTEYCKLDKQSSRAIQGITTDGTYIYYIDWFGDNVDSYLVKCNLDGTEISRNNIGRGHFNSICYCSKDEYLYITTNPVTVYDTVNLSLVKSITTPVYVGTIDYLPTYDVFIFNRINTNEYFYMTYENLNNSATILFDFKNMELIYLYRFIADAYNDVRQGACFAGDFFFKISDRQRFGKHSTLIKYTQYGQYCCDVIPIGIPTEKEYEDMFYLNDYFYIVTADGIIYKSSKYDYNNKNILDYDTDPTLSRVYGMVGSRFTIYNKNIIEWPESIIPQVGTIYNITNITNPMNAKYIDILYLIEGQRNPPVVARATLNTSNRFIINDIRALPREDEVAFSIFRGVFEISETNNEYKIEIKELFTKVAIYNGSVLTYRNVNNFEIFGFIAQY